MRIAAASIRDILRVRNVTITPDADANFILIGGENGEGKSSILNTLSMAFGGKNAFPIDPVRHGAEDGEATIVLDNGLTIKLVVKKDGTSRLELTDKDGKLRSPQERLNKIVGSRMLDPIAFTLLSPADQRARLLQLIDSEGKIAALDERHERIYDKRTEVGRDMKKAEGELARLTEIDVGTAIDVDALNSEMRVFADMQRAGDALGLVVRSAEQQLASASDRKERIQNEIRDLDVQLAALQKRRNDLATAESDATDALLAKRAEVKAANEKVADAGHKWLATLPRREQLDADLKRAGEHNRKVYEAEASNKRRREAAELVAKIDAQRTEQTKLLEKIEAQKLEILAAAKLPVEGLGVGPKEITLNGVPFSQASAAEKMRVALALAIAASPQLDDIWIKDGALLDLTSLKLIADHAKAAGKRLWIERVGDRDPGAIIIEDGMVRDRLKSESGSVAIHPNAKTT